MKQKSPTERVRDARRNLAQIEELHSVVVRLLKETESILASLEDPDNPDGDAGASHPFQRRG